MVENHQLGQVRMLPSNHVSCSISLSSINLLLTGRWSSADTLLPAGQRSVHQYLRSSLLGFDIIIDMKRVHCVGILLFQYYLSVASYAVSRGGTVQLAVDWSSNAIDHVRFMEDLLYPPGDNMKVRVHQVRQHPIYNFLHTYYRYSTKSIKKYSPGLGIKMEAVPSSELAFLNEKFLKITPEGITKKSLYISSFVCIARLEL